MTVLVDFVPAFVYAVTTVVGAVVLVLIAARVFRYALSADEDDDQAEPCRFTPS